MTSIASQKTFSLASARSVGSYVVRLAFEDGCQFDLDLAPDLIAISGPLVSPLENPEVFSRMEIRHGSLVFPTGLDYGGDVLRLWCENGGVTNQERTDELARKYFGTTAPWSAAA
ncbi:MAG: DUF2442 domain-containing protein [Verrucomicrobia bacterium]|jgi:hypothetical protein|nr:DUF2442 domain-containing protein [Verrucomicrobiota bacterium]